MKLKQLSVFLENKPGRLRELCALLADSGINMITISLADTEQFGILRLIVSDCDAAKAVLEEKGFVAKITEVIAVEVNDEPGGLGDVLKVEDAAGISVEYMYGLHYQERRKCRPCFSRFDDMDKAVTALQSAGFKVLDSVSLFQRTDG